MSVIAQAIVLHDTRDGSGYMSSCSVALARVYHAGKLRSQESRIPASRASDFCYSRDHLTIFGEFTVLGVHNHAGPTSFNG